jgi:hypothetical protein
MAITIPIAINIPQIHPFFNKWLAIELAPLSRVLAQITQGLGLVIMQIVTKFNHVFSLTLTTSGNSNR